MSNYDGILLASGGMDSTVLAYDLAQKGENIILLFLDYGQHCVNKEYETLKNVSPTVYKNNIRTIRIGDIYKESHSRMIIEANLWTDNVVADDLYLPYRNLLFLSIASAYAQSLGVKNVYSAFINRDKGTWYLVVPDITLSSLIPYLAPHLERLPVIRTSYPAWQN